MKLKKLIKKLKKKKKVIPQKEDLLISSKLGLTNQYVNLIVDYNIPSGYKL